MAISDITEIWKGREGGQKPGDKNHSRVFHVRTNNRYDTDVEIAAALAASNFGIKLGTPFHRDSESYCAAIRSIQQSGPFDWLTTCSYTSSQEFSTNPLNDPAVIEWDSEQHQEPAYLDRNDKPNLTKAGELFNPPAMKDQSRRTISIKKNVAQVPGWFLNYEDAINSDSFSVRGFSIPKFAAKCQRVRISDAKNRSGVEFFVLSMVLHLNKKGWRQRVLHAGFIERDPDDPTKQREIRLDDGSLPTTPVPLDEDGYRLEDPTPDNVVHIEQENYDEFPFAVMNSLFS